MLALEGLQVELGNLRVALRWADEQGERELCARIALALHQALYFLGYWTEARSALQTGLSATQAMSGDATALQAQIKHHLASLLQDMGHLDEARTLAEESLNLYFTFFNKEGIADTFNLLGLILTDQKDYDGAAQYFNESLSMRAADDHANRAKAYHNLALLASLQGNYPDARRLYEESLNHRRQAGDARGISETLSGLGSIAFKEGNLVEAGRLFRESLTQRRALRDQQGIAILLYNLAEIAEHEGDMDRAILMYLHSERIFQELQHSFLAPVQETLQHLEQQLGAEPLARARQEVAQTPWELLIETAPSPAA
jgi:tetratricopeptide (TPR) repeat protein